jgi:hypothetical protein
VRVRLATEAGSPARPNEDFAAVAPGVAVLLDGAGLPVDRDTGCVHGIAWYARTLGGLLIAGACDTGTTLAEVLSKGIEQVSHMHAGTCDLRHPDTPSATVIIARQHAVSLEYLVLCDSVLLLQPRDGEVRIVTDTRIADVAGPLRPARRNTASGTPRDDAAWRAYGRQIDAARNQPGGFWIAAADPQVAAQALTGSEPLGTLSAVALLSDGASRLADRYHLVTWPQMCAILAGGGPAEVISQVRDAEKTDMDGERWPRGKISDDATVIHWLTAD